MAKLETIKQYLVGLGFSVSTGELRHFEDTIKQVTRDVERLAGNMTKGFAAAGVAIGGVLTGVGVGVLDLMNNTAKADLGFQVFARRMYMSVDAAKQMKIATDALGYSLNDIIWGPKELYDRYGTLVTDQRRMQAGLGPDFEAQMRHIRDVRFEFTRMGVEAEYFGMQFTKSVMDKLFGGPESLDKRLDQLNIWFQTNMPRIADQLATTIIPAMEAVGRLAAKIFTTKNVDWVVNVVTKGADNLGLLYNFATGAGGNDPTSSAGGLWDNSKTFNQNMNGLLGSERDDNIGKIMKAARDRGLDVPHVLALFDQETGGKFNANAVGPMTRSGKQALGLGQLMPDKIPAGADPFDPDTNIGLTLGLVQQLLRKNKGDWHGVANDYYGHGSPMPGQPSFEQYWQQYQQKEQIWERQNRPSGAYGAYEPSAYKGGVDIGGVTVHVANSNAHPQEIANAVIRAIDEKMGRRAQDHMAQFTGVYA